MDIPVVELPMVVYHFRADIIGEKDGREYVLHNGIYFIALYASASVTHPSDAVNTFLELIDWQGILCVFE